MKEFIEEIIKQIVTHPEEVSVSDEGSVLQIFVSPSDAGTVIGKEGRNIRALRSVANLKSVKLGLPRYELKVNQAEQKVVANSEEVA